MLSSINYLGHEWEFVDADSSAGGLTYGPKVFMQTTYKCIKCTLYSFIDVKPESNGAIDITIKMEETMQCIEYANAKDKAIASHNFVRDNKYTHLFRCTVCHLESASISSVMPIKPMVLLAPSWIGSTLITCAEVQLHNILL